MIRSTTDDHLLAFLAGIETRLPGYRDHASRVRDYVSSLLNESSSYDSVDRAEILVAALLHDIGKTKIPQEFLKRPGPLSKSELGIMRQHAVFGGDMALQAVNSQQIAMIVRHHHEWWNGAGYPAGLSCFAIPYGSRCIAVADAFDAMTSERPYRSALRVDDALQELRRCRGTQFDPQIIDTFLAMHPTRDLSRI